MIYLRKLLLNNIDDLQYLQLLNFATSAIRNGAIVHFIFQNAVQILFIIKK